ncbi:protein of unknown function [Methylocaldum szegediense]|uniref:Uncharacterized protein n=1 Tax=Methylocaldum szegediense TaxID=73780 RepID=A0ABM9I729_9GAMM|nr:protein of unknown function [Methylocaldum szegediense]
MYRPKCIYQYQRKTLGVRSAAIVDRDSMEFKESAKPVVPDDIDSFPHLLFRCRHAQNWQPTFLRAYKGCLARACRCLNRSFYMEAPIGLPFQGSSLCNSIDLAGLTNSIMPDIPCAEP